MRSLDTKAIQDYGIPSLLLMENAGRGVAELIFHQSRGKRVTILAGTGNNGGDGFVIARHLHNRGFQVYVLLAADPATLKADPSINYAILQKMKIPVEQVDPGSEQAYLEDTLRRADIVVDALFGVGLTRTVEGIFARVIAAVNQAAKQIVAVDIPSGLHADTGEVLGCAVRASQTATLGLPKEGLLKGAGPEYSGKVVVIDISLPRELILSPQT